MRATILCGLLVCSAVGHASPLCDIDPCQLNVNFANGGELRVAGHATLVFGESAIIQLGQDGDIDLGAEGEASFDIHARPIMITAGDTLLLTESGKIRFGAQGGFGLGNNGTIDVASGGKLTIDSSSDVRLASHGSVYVSRIWNDGTTNIEAGTVNLGASEQSLPGPLANIEVIGKTLQSKIDIRAEQTAYVGSVDASAALDTGSGENLACKPLSDNVATASPAPASGGVMLTGNGNVSISTGTDASSGLPVNEGSTVPVVCAAYTGPVAVADAPKLVEETSSAGTESTSADGTADSSDRKQTGIGAMTFPLIGLLVLMHLFRELRRWRVTTWLQGAGKKFNHDRNASAIAIVVRTGNALRASVFDGASWTLPTAVPGFASAATPAGLYDLDGGFLLIAAKELSS